MVSRVLSSLVCFLCVILLPAVWAESCKEYRDQYGEDHDKQQCFSQHCCGTCDFRYCCSDSAKYLYQDKHCPGRGDKKSKLAVLLGSILGSIFPIICCVGVIICCVAPCCFCYKKCRKGRGRQAPPTVVNIPLQPTGPSGYHPSHPGYQPVPGQPGHGGLPDPTAPPPYYFGNNDPAHPGAFGPRQPMYPFPNQPYAPPPHSGQHGQLPYNLAYGQNL